MLNIAGLHHSKDRTPRIAKHWLHRLAAIVTLPLLNPSALAFETNSLQIAAPEFYPHPLSSYRQPLQFDLRYAPAFESGDSETRLKLSMQFSSNDAARPAGGALQGVGFLGRHRERNDVEDLRLNLATPNDRVRFSFRQSQSFYAADADYLRMLARKNQNRNSPGKERFLFQQGTEGSANLARLDVDVIRSEWVRTSAFASRSNVDANYESLTSEKLKDEFSIANRANNAGGGNIGLGAISFAASYTVSTGLSGVASLTETRQDRSVTLDLTYVRKRLGDMVAASMIGALSPSGIYGGNFSKETRYEGAGGAQQNRTTGISAGAYWTWDGGSANVSYWNYYLDSPHLREASYDSSGRGLHASVAIYGTMLQYYGGFIYRRSVDLAPLSRAVDQGYDVYSSISYKSPSAFPDIIVDGTLGWYGYNSLLHNNDATYWSGTVGLDFSKFLWSSAEPQDAVVGKIARSHSLKLFYRYTNKSSRGGGSESRSDDHFSGIMFQIGPSDRLNSQLGKIDKRP